MERKGVLDEKKGWVLLIFLLLLLQLFNLFIISTKDSRLVAAT